MHRLYIDETGNADLHSSADPNHRYLSLTGVIVHHDHVRTWMTPLLDGLKEEIFSPDPDEPLVLHRKDIMNRTKGFQVLRDPDKAAEFDRRLLRYLHNSDYTVLTAVIDKQEHLNRYAVWRYEPYHYCMEVLLERYVMWLRKNRAFGDVMGEVRGGKVDRKLEAAYARLYKNGGSFVSAKDMQRYLTSGKLKLKPKDRNITGLQIADILAHPSALYVRSIYAKNVTPRSFGRDVANILIQQKYDRAPWGKLDGWGYKWLP